MSFSSNLYQTFWIGENLNMKKTYVSRTLDIE